MDAQTIWLRHRERPFRSFYLLADDRRQFCIDHPRKLMVSKVRVTLPQFIENANMELDIADDVMTYSPEQIVKMWD